MHLMALALCQTHTGAPPSQMEGVTSCASDRESVDVGNFQTVRNLRQYLKVEDDASSEHLRVIQGYILTSATRCRGK